jgi:3-dehydroquinate synthase
LKTSQRPHLLAFICPTENPMLSTLRRLLPALGLAVLLTGCGYNDFQRLDEQVKSGWAEVLKHGLICDAAFFDWLAGEGSAGAGGDPAALTRAVVRSVEIKSTIVGEDEKEAGRRALLNLGHTFGHALEADTGFSDRLFHGEAVAAGMALAFRYSVRLGLCAAEDAQRVSQLLKAAGLPTTLSDAGVTANGALLVDYMRHDKKMSGGTLPFLLARGIGQTFLSKDVVMDDVAAFLNDEAQS